MTTTRRERTDEDRPGGRRSRTQERGARGPLARKIVAGATPMSLGLGVAGVAVAILGLWLVARGEITAAPILLVLAYLVLFPLALTR
jgi:hypothetical protein